MGPHTYDNMVNHIVKIATRAYNEKKIALYYQENISKIVLYKINECVKDMGPIHETEFNRVVGARRYKKHAKS